MVVALRGTMSLADVVTDAVAVPERVDGWLPKGVLQRARQGRRNRKSFAHSGMVSITQQLEIDLNNKCGSRFAGSAARILPSAGVLPQFPFLLLFLSPPPPIFFLLFFSFFFFSFLSSVFFWMFFLCADE